MNLITDRTKSDVLLGTEKGQYTFADLNRVERAVEELARALPGGLIDQLYIKTDWGLPGTFSSDQWPTKAQMDRYLSNIKVLISTVIEYATQWPPLPESMVNLNWEGANQIELALLTIHRIIGSYSGFLGRGELGRMTLGRDDV